METAMREITFACQPNVEGYARTSRREEFLNTMESTVPWAELEALIALHYPQGRQGVLAEYLPLAFESSPMLYFFGSERESGRPPDFAGFFRDWDSGSAFS